MSHSSKILIVDDEPLIRDALVFKLSRDGFEVRTAEDGEKAIEAIDQEDFDVIISDIMMPFISGFELLKILKERGTKSPILMLTSLNSDTAENQAYDLGADDYVTKPFNPKDLTERIKKLLDK